MIMIMMMKKSHIDNHSDDIDDDYVDHDHDDATQTFTIAWFPCKRRRPNRKWELEGDQISPTIYTSISISQIFIIIDLKFIKKPLKYIYQCNLFWHHI